MNASTLRLALIGYGKMGRAIEAAATAQGHTVALRIHSQNTDTLTAEALRACDVAIEFTNPHSAPGNIRKCIDAGVPVVSGSTGWLDQWEEIAGYCLRQQGALLYASNFSIGVNLFFQLNEYLAKLMARYPEYRIALEEIHHTQKKDAPSGTAITLAETILKARPDWKGWTLAESPRPACIPVTSKREDPAPGTHTVSYRSAIDDTEITHTAHSREGFARGAVWAAGFLKGKTGLFSMKDVLKEA